MPPKSPVESDMLEFAADEIRANSRLGCQVQVTEAMDGLVVHLPEFQI
jgi:2Fe-2S ferredoxin